MKSVNVSCVILICAFLCVDLLCYAVEDQPENPGQVEKSSKSDIATFAGGCFWCIEADLEKQPGVIEVVSGYTGGDRESATYTKVSSGVTKHYEAVQVYYDPQKITYTDLLDAFWKHVDPTDVGGQFVDRGTQYRTAIFYHDVMQKEEAERSKNELKMSGRFSKPLVTPVIPLGVFYAAEAYHQDYYKTHPKQYYRYRKGSGRDLFIKKVWGKGAEHAKGTE